MENKEAESKEAMEKAFRAYVKAVMAYMKEKEEDSQKGYGKGLVEVEKAL